MRYDEDKQSLLRNTLAVVLAGGKGSRLEPLTRDRAKPAVPFGGSYRIIDFTLSNCINSGLRKILVLTQYKAMSLDRHINLGWRPLLSRELGEFIDVVPPQQRIDEHWYQGTADAVYQNIYTLEKERPTYVRDSGRRPHLQDELRHAGRVSPGHERRSDDRRPARRRRRIAAFRRHADRCRRPGGRLRGEKGPRPTQFPAIRGIAWPRWAFTCSTPAFCSSSCASMRRGQAATTTSATTSFRRSSTRTACSPFPSATKTASKTPTGATWARSTPISRRTWTWCTSIRC